MMVVVALAVALVNLGLVATALEEEPPTMTVDRDVIMLVAEDVRFELDSGTLTTSIRELHDTLQDNLTAELGATQTEYQALLQALDALGRAAGANFTTVNSRLEQLDDSLSEIVNDAVTPLSLRVAALELDSPSAASLNGASRDAAARSCQGIYEVDPSFSNGTFWLDPNGGSTRDAVQLTCERAGNVVYTVVPAMEILPLGQHFGTPRGDSYASLQSALGADAFDYGGIPMHQIQALARHSTRAHQRVQVDCMGIVTSLWDERTYYYENPIVMVALNGDVWTLPTGDQEGFDSRIFRPNIVMDNCSQNGNDVLGLSVYDLEGPATALPIVDLWIHDQGDANEYVGFRIGEVRFTENFFGPEAHYGSRLRPGRSCLDIFMHGQAFNDTLYAIDPNGGDPRDYVMAFCNMSGGGWTGVSVTEQVPFRAWNSEGGGDGHRFFSTLDDGFTIPYSMRSNQLSALLALSSEATQMVSVDCIDAIVYERESDGSLNFAFIFEGYNGFQWLHQNANYTVLHDGCKANDSVRRASVISLTGQADRLPIVDFAPSDLSGPNEHIGLNFTSVWIR
ncbi:uncharacterized protein MONBRDRAFT_31893 [Monosiga brevicollis MX1]|uniref:Fibrillar collagen NC1 domain-containing protein n=1 Tax=Monosiga brevicollis TaxID=81824 RepID=A9UW32_MONBE|nr:uncharacterized protein MONBRDRAFT_31893 [Monosiga brevicollis MX1]EDQ90697.1 predicted protein [Monosiga brevicollis MX1]|eukprot:XP_001744748.1 hypothetical protein [Monosiga brevicollis MX1]